MKLASKFKSLQNNEVDIWWMAEMHSQTRRWFNSVNYVSLDVHRSFNKLVYKGLKRLALLQITLGSFVINTDLLDICVKNGQKTPKWA